jgi:DNA adenine methylase
VALSIDGSKRSGSHNCVVDIPPGLFESEAMLDLGRSMLRRFQMQGQTLEAERVSDRLLRTWA